MRSYGALNAVIHDNTWTHKHESIQWESRIKSYLQICKALLESILKSKSVCINKSTTQLLCVTIKWRSANNTDSILKNKNRTWLKWSCHPTRIRRRACALSTIFHCPSSVENSHSCARPCTREDTFSCNAGDSHPNHVHNPHLAPGV